MKVLITGGGTGGHIYPAIAIANKIKDEIKTAQILFVGTEKGLESELVPKEGYNLETIKVSGFKRKISLDTAKSLVDLACGLKDSIKVILKFKPDIVIGTGGYVCGPVVFIASMLNIKTVIHEQNVIPGVTNKILGKFVNRVLVSFHESKKYFDNDKKVYVTGNPIRKEFIKISQESSKEQIGAKEDEFVVLSFGGSRGAEKINKIMAKVIEKTYDNKKIKIIHVTGSRHHKEVMDFFKEKGIGNNIKDSVKEYIYDMAKYMGAADLAICRAGAITLAEITAMGIPSILIPSPYVTNNHQEHNARVLEDKGAAILVKEAEFDEDIILENIYKLSKEKDKLNTMAKKSREIAKPNATDIIYSNILEVLKS
ncbi:undecaprenyldiphospho-muramoylpentapeptide beta-N-acetylglucosaminyltransferase [Anaeromicrobium sediminis]|uniref:UDP-N-acetylglucosamine--N-acetylmuramyl-(pentapeptide) pyrophosphoryl-undecaprenol N-acetylglucosamine transferase n=1 Tax=Anaeromicrobium sediminis TaxID=1478221 RepID=A0A267MGY3_9FIRM|nr:undecaprenyldiphospho-muramoylpentapeptide beta-N-acetylglucosaminyltransferase [Anaeromicrobium sediminis]PAB58829.1 undecaprenyldiphospho-muramoylpentapeptide beta-N-acetylglucosaminyltransferase [Anaeromicrobium sediminis]